MVLLNLLQKLSSDELISWAIYCVMRISSQFQPTGQPNNIMYFSLSGKSYSMLDLALQSIGKAVSEKCFSVFHFGSILDFLFIQKFRRRREFFSFCFQFLVI